MKIFVLIFFIPIMVTCNPLDELTPTYEYQNLPYNKAVKYIKDLPPDASDVYVKKHSTIDSAIIFIRFTFKSGKSLQNYLALKGRSLNLRKVPSQKGASGACQVAGL